MDNLLSSCTKRKEIHIEIAEKLASEISNYEVDVQNQMIGIIKAILFDLRTKAADDIKLRAKEDIARADFILKSCDVLK